MFSNTHEFRIEIDQMTNRPSFSSFIQIHKNPTTIPFKVDVNLDNNTVIYSNKTLVFHTPDNVTWDENSEYYITFDEGIFYSNSTAQKSPDFWHLTTTNQRLSSTTISSHTKSTKYPLGEDSPPYATRLGIGLGLTFIILLILIEVLYFIYCYRARKRDGSYSP